MKEYRDHALSLKQRVEELERTCAASAAEARELRSERDDVQAGVGRVCGVGMETGIQRKCAVGAMPAVV
jgi:hypothetical protein